MSPQAREEYHAVLYKRHKDCWNKFGMSKKYSRFRS